MSRQRATTPEQETRIRELRDEGKTQAEIAETVGVSRTVVRRVLKEDPSLACAREGESSQDDDNHTVVSTEATEPEIIASYKETGSMRKTAEALGTGVGRVNYVMGKPEYSSVKSAMKRARKAGVEIRTGHVEEEIRRAEIAVVDGHAKDMGEWRRTEKKIAKSAMDMYNMVVAAMQIQFRKAIDTTSLEVKDDAAFGEFWKRFGPKDAAQAHKIWRDMIDPNSVPGNYFEWFVAEIADGIATRVKDQDLQLSLLTLLNVKMRETRNAIKQGRDLEIGT